MPIGGSFVVAAPLGLHAVKLLLHAALACRLSSHAITCAYERRSRKIAVDESIMKAMLIERMD